ncbi:MAG: site-specific DNA-methyltransferase [Selenomonadaceae bacterium]|nr:site-specific DNA-methyltransferase [Selenomonadaceae bacterium]
MPSLDWAGKAEAVAAAKNAPYRLLLADERLSYGDLSLGNAIVQGDNLDALKSLLPYYAGRVRCVYIDPPYNTHSAFEHYDDSVEHSTWLSLMYPRLELLREFLAEDGSIWISIDDREYASLKLICDEIFGLDCFVSNISWQRNYSARHDSKGIVNEVEHILVYSRKPDWQPNKLPRTAEMNKRYKNPDNDTRIWRTDNAYAPGALTHQGMVYAIQHPFTGEMLYPSNGRCWTFAQVDMFEIMCNWCEYELKDIHDEAKRAEICGVTPEEVRPGVMGIVLSRSLEESRKQAQAVYKRGQWPRLFFTKGGKGGIARKTYLDSVGDVPPTNFWPYSEVGHTDEAKKEILKLFEGKAPFATPKPERLLRRVIALATNPGDLVLDSFLGSGTTAAVAQKMGRQYIGVEIGDHATTHVVPRMKKVIDGEAGGISKEENWTGGGGFVFYRLGEALFDEDGSLQKGAPFSALAAHIWHAETETAFLGDEETTATGIVNEARPIYGHVGENSLLGVHKGVAYYLLYNGVLGDKRPQGGNVLTRKVLQMLPPYEGPKIIFGESCRIQDEGLKELKITFRQTPSAVKR